MGTIALSPQNEQLPRLLLIDPHPAAREGLALRLELDRVCQLCGQAGDVASAFSLTLETRPDVIVMDIALKGSGIELLKRVCERLPSVRALVWSRYQESIYAERVIRAGAAGYIEKEQPTATVVEAIRHILKGKVYLSPRMTENLLLQAGGKSNNLAADPVSALSDRELEVFRMIGLCRDTQQIADDLHLSQKTVETYRGRIKTKFSLDTSAELLRAAVQWELENG